MAAPRVSDTPEVQQHYAAQLGLSAALLAALRKLWPRLEPDNLAATSEPVIRGAAALVEQFSLASISLAADYYDDLRAEHVPGRLNTPIIDATSVSEMQAMLEATTRDLLAELPSLVDEVFLAEYAAQLQGEVDAALQVAVANSASDEIFTALEGDREAKGWARVTRPGACAFCRMLASRGAVYLTRGSANFRAHVPIDGRGGVCKCQVEPLFGDYYEPPAHVRTDMGTWERVTEGLSGADAINEFRREVEGRADGKRSRRRRKGDPKRQSRPAKAKGGQRLGFEFLTPAQLQHHLDVVESLPDSDYRTRQIERLRNRLAELGD